MFRQRKPIRTLYIIVFAMMCLVLFIATIEYQSYITYVLFGQIDTNTEFGQLITKLGFIDVTNIGVKVTTNIEDPPIRPHKDACGANKYYRCPDKEHCECKYMCGDDYTTLTVFDTDTIVYNGFRLRPGRYCVKGDGHRYCQRNLSHIVYGGNQQWSCVCKYPHYFGGPNCSTFVACAGKVHAIMDSKTGKHVENEDLYSTNYDETLEDGTLRYKCDCSRAYDANFNKRIGDPIYPYKCWHDPCTASLYDSSAPGMRPDWTKGCDCGKFLKNALHGNPMSPCTNCSNETDDFSRFHDVECYEPHTPYKHYQQAKKPIFPCAKDKTPSFCGNADVQFQYGTFERDKEGRVTMKSLQPYLKFFKRIVG